MHPMLDQDDLESFKQMAREMSEQINKIGKDSQLHFDLISKFTSPKFPVIDMSFYNDSHIHSVMQSAHNAMQQIDFESLYNSFSPALQSLRNFEQTFQSFYKNNSATWNTLANIVKNAEEYHTLEALLEHGWVISPYLLDDGFLKQQMSSTVLNMKNKEVNEKFINYFLKDNWKVVEGMLANWESNLIFKKRIKIFKDTLQLLRAYRSTRINKSGVNICLFIVPTLIAQIEGISTEIAISLGLQKNKERKWVIEGEKQTYEDHEWMWQLPADGYDSHPIELLETFLFTYAVNTKLYTPNPKRKTEKLAKRPFANFIRHKIMHGETYRHGQIDHVLRLLLILDFLATIQIK